MPCRELRWRNEPRVEARNSENDRESALTVFVGPELARGFPKRRPYTVGRGSTQTHQTIKPVLAGDQTARPVIESDQPLRMRARTWTCICQERPRDRAIIPPSRPRLIHANQSSAVWVHEDVPCVRLADF